MVAPYDGTEWLNELHAWVVLIPIMRIYLSLKSNTRHSRFVSERCLFRV